MCFICVISTNQNDTMNLQENAIYHVYNRSNESIFQSEEDYWLFLQKLVAFIEPGCHILAWCLIPNHFHLLIKIKAEGAQWGDAKNRYRTQRLSETLSFLIGTYTQTFNRRYGRKGQLFAHPTKAKLLSDPTGSYFSGFGQVDYVTTCFLYIHQTPVMAGLVEEPWQWEMSSFNDYIGLRSQNFVNKEIAFQHLTIAPDEIDIQSTSYLDEVLLDALY